MADTYAYGCLCGARWNGYAAHCHKCHVDYNTPDELVEHRIQSHDWRKR